jgi:hypothetical protein
MAPFKFQDEINIEQEKTTFESLMETFNEVAKDDSTLSGFNFDQLEFDFEFEDVPIKINTDVPTSNSNETSGNDLLKELVTSTIGALPMTPPEMPMIPTVVTFEAIPDEISTEVVTAEAKKRGRGRPCTSGLKANCEGINDQAVRRRQFNNAASARHRYNHKRKHDEMEEALIFETEKKTKLVREVEQLEKEVEEYKAKIHALIKRPRLDEPVVVPEIPEPIAQVVPEPPTVQVVPSEENIPDFLDLLLDPSFDASNLIPQQQQPGQQQQHGQQRQQQQQQPGQQLQQVSSVIVEAPQPLQITKEQQGIPSIDQSSLPFPTPSPSPPIFPEVEIHMGHPVHPAPTSPPKCSRMSEENQSLLAKELIQLCQMQNKEWKARQIRIMERRKKSGYLVQINTDEPWDKNGIAGGILF